MSYWRISWIWQDTPECFFQFVFDVYSNVSINPQAPLLQALEREPTPTKLEDETRDTADENKKKEEHLYPIVHCPSTVPLPLFD